MVLSLILSTCGEYESTLQREFGFDVSNFTVLQENDSHGGFLGDGVYYITLDCSNNVDKARDIASSWKALPFSEGLNACMYGGEFNGVNYSALVDKAYFPKVENGVYKFLDRYSSEYVANREDETLFLTRRSYNFSVAIYDFDADCLYYFEIDT